MNKHADREAAEKIIEFLDQWEETHSNDRRDDDEACDPLQLAALQSLMQMNASRALPVLQRVLQDHTKCAELREKAIFVLAQHQSPESTRLLLDAARNDPETRVRQQAVFWLSQISGDESLAALREIAMDRTDPDVQEKAIFALAQHSSRGAVETLREIARNTENSLEVRQQAIFWIGQTKESFEFLSSLYAALPEFELREKVLFSISQSGTKAARTWLRERALDANESQELRKKALFWLSQMGGLSCQDMEKLYREFTEREMKEQVVFGMSQMHETCATNALIELARTEKDQQLLEKIVFWLGQTGDDEALDFLEELIDR
jgi:HEAT repeat protein